ncbi:protein kinase C-binding protein NELL1 isoform X2 [Daphnia magna]|uniref:protein kinase C-binding protein NELL1 isoform X2 n=1 Tax=Daphnia magna TaxID=35525 RepID=UPI001E1BD8E2|nr:protein kinase C-binding protein NELL1 isoform X2 [Daphnia magna]
MCVGDERATRRPASRHEEMNWPTSSPSLLLVLPASASSSKRIASSPWTVFTVSTIVVLAVFTHLAESTTTTNTASASGWDWTAGRNNIDILDELAAVRHNLTGVEVAPGPYSISPALYFTGDNRTIRLLDTSYAKVMTLLQSHHDITFVAAVRQEPYNVGTLFSLSEGFTRFLELQSSGRKDEIRLHYNHLGVPRVETFSYRLADGVWHRLAVTVSGGVASLYVDCRRVERRWMAAIPDTAIIPESSSSSVPVAEKKDNKSANKMSLWIGQRGDQHFLFKGAMQDVNLIAGSNGHLVQCPAAEAECPTCGEFHSLQSVVARLEKSLQHLTNKLEHAEERLTQLEQCDCPRSCSVNGTVHADGTSWHSDCDVCSCHKGQVTCSPVQCPNTPCRNPVQLPGQCCRTCLKPCFFHGIKYDHGERASPRHCLECQCINASMQCQPLDPELHCPALSCPPSEQFTVANECCKQCPDINECEAEGGPGGHRCGANTICVNTVGSYRCDCLPGYYHLGSGPDSVAEVHHNGTECVEYDECANKLDNDCHPTLATCINTPGSYQCACRPGYRGNGIECEPVCDRPCQNGGRCVAPNQCSCRRGFEGEFCETDVNECERTGNKTTGHQCHANSECRNMPGWYACACKPGFRSPRQDILDTFLGALCQDVDECAEGLHSCHGNTQCLNTIGSYECRCPPTNPNCSLVCHTEEGVRQSGETWTSYESPCVSCQCREGVVTCSKLPCHCTSSSSISSSSSSASSGDLESTAKFSLHRNQTVVHHPNSELCCPQCRSSKSQQCRHQEKSNVIFDSGQRWIYQCQSCECLHGETDCWSMECPPVYCSHPVRLPGDCCLRCPDSDPCSAVEEPMTTTTSQFGEPQGCHHLGRNYTHGTEWAAGLDGCNNCKCKNGKVCCQYDTRCAQQRLVVDLEHSAVVQHRQRHHQHQPQQSIRRGSNRINRSSSEGFTSPTTDNVVEQRKKGGGDVLGSTTKSTTLATTTRSGGSRITTAKTTIQAHRMSRSARRARSDNSADQNDKNYVKSSSVVQQSTMIPFTTNSSPSSSTLKDGSSSRMLSGSTESQHVPEATQVEAFLFDSGIISTKIVSQQQPESSGPT